MISWTTHPSGRDLSSLPDAFGLEPRRHSRSRLCINDSAANRDCDKKSRRIADVGGNAGRGHYAAAAQVEDQVWNAGRVARFEDARMWTGTIWLPTSRTFLGGAVRLKPQALG